MSSRDVGILRTLHGVLRRPVPPAHRLDLAFGWLVAVLFGVQLLTGLLLSFYYQPSPALVAPSLEFIMRDVHWGWLFRGVHYWASDVLIVVVVIQLTRLFVLGAYSGARSASWYIACLILLLMVASAFSGELLRADAVAFGRMTHSLTQIDSLPLLGPWVADLLRGDEEVSASTLGRAWTGHALVLPWAGALLVFLNQWILARRVQFDGPAPESGSEHGGAR